MHFLSKRGTYYYIIDIPELSINELLSFQSKTRNYTFVVGIEKFNFQDT